MSTNRRSSVGEAAVDSGKFRNIWNVYVSPIFPASIARRHSSILFQTTFPISRLVDRINISSIQHSRCLATT